MYLRVLLLRSNSHKNTFFFAQSYIFQSRSITQTFNKQEAALKMYQIATVNSHPPTCSFVSGLDTEPVCPRSEKGSRNKRPDGGHSCAASVITWIWCLWCQCSGYRTSLGSLQLQLHTSVRRISCTTRACGP